MGSCSSVVSLSPQQEKNKKREIRPIHTGTPVSHRQHVSFDVPFEGYDPGVKLPYSSSQGKSQKRSASMVALERIMAERANQVDYDVNSPFSSKFSTKPPTSDKKRMSLVARTRRMSSVMNEFTVQVNNLLSGGEYENTDAYLRRAFSLLDTQGKKVVSEENLMKGLGKMRSKSTVKIMFAAADGNKDGHLDWEEFSKFFRYLKEGDCILAENADIDSALEKNMQNLFFQKPVIRRRLHDIKISNLPSQAGRAKCVAMSPGSDIYAVTHRNECTIHIYTLSGVEVRQLTGHSDSLLGITFSPDKKYIATASRDWTMMLWDSTAGQPIQCIQHEGVVTAVAFSFNGKNIYTGCQDNVVRRLAVPKGRLKSVLKDLPNRKSGVILALATQHTKNEQVIFSRSCDKSAYVADAQNLSVIKQLGAHDTIVWHTRFSPDDSLILTCCEQKLNIWNTQFLTIAGTFDSRTFTSNRTGAFCTAAVFSPPNFENLLLVFTSQRQFYLLNIDTGNVLLDVTLRAPVYASACDFINNVLVCGDDYGNIYKIKLV